jgi:dolichol kinase
VTIAVAVLHWGTAASPWNIAAVAIGVGAVAMLLELVPVRVDDNLTIPIVVGFTAWAMAWLAGVPVF